MRVTIFLLSAIAQLTAFTSRSSVVAEPIPLAARAVPSVDLGYSTYQGTFDANYSVNIFKGY